MRTRVVGRLPGLRVLAVLVATGASLQAQQSQLGADFAHEAQEFSQACSGSFFKAVAGCAQDLFTDNPVHIGMGSLAPGNGFGAGPAFVAHHTPNERWRLSWNADAVAAGNLSWRAGLYMTAIYIPRIQITPVLQPAAPAAAPRKADLVVQYPVINAYAQTTTLNTLQIYGLGPGSSILGQAQYGLRETITGANVLWPVVRRWKLSLFGELNGRFVSLRNTASGSTPSLEQSYTEATLPGLISQPGVLQLGAGVRFTPALIRDYLKLNYALTLQQFAAPGSNASFTRFTADLGHDFPFYGKVFPFERRVFNGPNECAASPGARCPPIVRNLWGSFGLRLLISESFAPSGNVVPFYFQPTLGGSDINGAQWLASYNDYRFRAPNLLVARASFEHAIWGPLGFLVQADEGQVALQPGDLGFNHLAHTYAAGVTLRAGGLPQVSLLFAWGGQKTTHTLIAMDASLLGGSARPSLF
ncbi:MAG: hypothetical protein ACLQBJ_11415 [Bryobacteraceae bacterium]